MAGAARRILRKRERRVDFCLLHARSPNESSEQRHIHLSHPGRIDAPSVILKLADTDSGN
jgi:hypothetical protein